MTVATAPKYDVPSTIKTVSSVIGRAAATKHYDDVVGSGTLRFATLEGFPPIDLVGEDPRMIMIQRSSKASPAFVAHHHLSPNPAP